MADEPETLPEDAAQAQAADAATTTAQGDDTPADDEVSRLRDQLLRSQAEMENLRRRNARDVENAHKFGVEKLLGDLLPALDSYEKGIEEAAKLEGEAGAAVAQGLELAQKLFLETVAKYGLTTEHPLGEPFDPQKHEAMAMVPNPDMEPNSVMEVLQRGYLLHDRVVRAAKVIVSRAVDG